MTPEFHELEAEREERFLSRAECAALAQRVSRLAVGGGTTAFFAESTWRGNLSWARNEITTSGDIRDDAITISRAIRGAEFGMDCNQINDQALEAAVRRAERIVASLPERSERDLPREPFVEPHAEPIIWDDAAFTLQAAQRAVIMRHLIQPARAAGMHAAGYIQVSAQGRAVMDDRGTARYYPYTRAQYSVTVRDPLETGSGWAGVDWYAWSKIDTERLSALALEKCLASRNPVAVEPGRYTAILEPQAVCDLAASLFSESALDRRLAENGIGPYAQGGGDSKIGQRMFDERITVTTDCMDPDLGFAPFSRDGQVYYPVTWVNAGVLQTLAYRRNYAVEKLGLNHGLPASGAFRMSGGTTSVAEMIATTQRGVLVTRLSGVTVVHDGSMLSTGYTRDGLWLIEHGKIAKPIRNFRFTESPIFALNNIEQLGAVERVFHPYAPVVAPVLKVRDFSFTSLSDSV